MPHSLQSRIIHKSMGLMNMKQKFLENIRNNAYSKKAAPIPSRMMKNFVIETSVINNRNVWEIHAGDSDSQYIIFYFHGGAYYANMIIQHWHFIEQLATATKATVIVPDYPLAPESIWEDVYHFTDEVYHRFVHRYPEKRIVLMGDSAGGGIALAYSQKLREMPGKQASEIILLSPWLDVSMSNPDLQLIDKYDNLLSIAGLKEAGEKYAGKLDLKDYRISPLYGKISGLGRISVFTGTNDILNADARKLKLLLENQGADLNFHEYPGLFHAWAIFTFLEESKDVILKIKNLCT